jgi:hypothetical protein
VHPVLARIFGGLSPHYYFRNLVFGLVYQAIFWSAASHSHKSMPIASIILSVVVLTTNTLLYPYSRFVYESIVNFIVGWSVYFVNAVLMVVVKWMTMTFCWAFAIFTAPIGVAYLYFARGRSGATS